MQKFFTVLALLLAVIPEDDMRKVIQRVRPGCVIIMDTRKNITKY